MVLLSLIMLLFMLEGMACLPVRENRRTSRSLREFTKRETVVDCQKCWVLDSVKFCEMTRQTIKNCEKLGGKWTPIRTGSDWLEMKKKLKSS